MTFSVTFTAITFPSKIEIVSSLDENVMNSVFKKNYPMINLLFVKSDCQSIKFEGKSASLSQEVIGRICLAADRFLTKQFEVRLAKWDCQKVENLSDSLKQESNRKLFKTAREFSDEEADYKDTMRREETDLIFIKGRGLYPTDQIK